MDAGAKILGVLATAAMATGVVVYVVIRPALHVSQLPSVLVFAVPLSGNIEPHFLGRTFDPANTAMTVAGAAVVHLTYTASNKQGGVSWDTRQYSPPRVRRF
jgi:hypothetical protein